MLLFNPVGIAPAHNMGFWLKLAVWHTVVVLRNEDCYLPPGRPHQVGRFAGQAIGPQTRRLEDSKTQRRKDAKTQRRGGSGDAEHSFTKNGYTARTTYPFVPESFSAVFCSVYPNPNFCNTSNGGPLYSGNATLPMYPMSFHPSGVV